MHRASFVSVLLASRTSLRPRQSQTFAESTRQRKKTTGCDVTNQWRNRPSLFVMAYDWRQDNATTALALNESHVFNLADHCQMITANEDGVHIGILGKEATLTTLLAYFADSR